MQSNRADVSFPVRFESGALEGEGAIENVGRGGVFVGSEQIPEKGQPVRLRFVGPRGQPVTVQGLVWWSTIDQDSYGAAREGFGVRIDEPPLGFVRLADDLLRRW